MTKKSVVTIKFETPCYSAKKALEHAQEIIRRAEALEDGGHGVRVDKYSVRSVTVTGA